MQYPDETIQSQYAASPTINALVTSFNEHVDPEADIKTFYDDIVNLDTATDAGLDIWGRIVAISRKVNVVSFEDVFGFNHSKLEPFDEGVFYQDVANNTGVFNFSDKAFRRLIYWKAFANISGVTLPEITNSLQTLFDSKLIAVKETGVMELTITLFFEPSTYQQALMKLYRHIYVGAGIKVNIEVKNLDFIGLVKGDGLQTFDNGTIYNDTL